MRPSQDLLCAYLYLNLGCFPGIVREESVTNIFLQNFPEEVFLLASCHRAPASGLHRLALCDDFAAAAEHDSVSRGVYTGCEAAFESGEPVRLPRATLSAHLLRAYSKL